MQPVDYLWPHVDLGNAQVYAALLLGDAMYDYSHGDTVEVENHMALSGHGVKFSAEKQKHKGVFRIADKEFDKEWLAKHMPKIKAEWNARKDRG
jgi:hypothetical protein